MSSKISEWDAKLYNEKHSFVYHYGQSLIELLNPKPHQRILDLGCGAGQLTFQISQLAKEVVGVDKSSEMIADARSKFRNITFEIQDASNFEFKNKFDCIFSNATLHWVKNYRSAAHCMYNNLKPNGKIVVEFGGKGNVEIIVNQLRDSLLQRNYVEQANVQPWYFPSIGEYASVLEEQGFKVISAEHYQRPTELADQNAGIIDWLTMFAKNFFYEVSYADQKAICKEVQERLKDKCFHKDKWFADYKRIRIVASKEEY